MRRRLSDAARAIRGKLPHLWSKHSDFADSPSHATNEWTPLVGGERIRAVFLVVTPQVWPSLEPVWRQASEDDRFETKVVVVEKNDAADALSGLIGARELLLRNDVPFTSGSHFDLRAYRPHLVFYPLPYQFYPKGFDHATANECGARIAYVPYGLEVGGGAANARYQHDELLQRQAWRIFVRSKEQQRNYGRYCASGNAHVVITGHPRSDRLARSEHGMHSAFVERAKGRKIILWAPHFSVATRRKWSSFLENHEAIISEIEKRSEQFFVMRPHPFLKRALRVTEGWSAKKTQALFDRITALENVYLDKAPDYWPVFAASDALMTDPGSFLVEYLLFDNPICLLDSWDNMGLSHEAAAFDAFRPGRTTEEIRRFMDDVAEGNDDKAQARASARREYFGDLDGRAAERIVEAMVSGMSDRAFVPKASTHTSDHVAALNYWKKATTTYLAPPEYYERQHAILMELLDRLRPSGFALDIGCGDGRFTELFAEHCVFVEGIDPGASLIAQAVMNAKERGIDNIEYRVGNIETHQDIASYDVVSCMGVLSGIIDNESFLRVTQRIRASAKPGGLLVLKESLSIGEPQGVHTDGYIAVYRNIDDYLEAFRNAGFSLEEETTIAPTNEQGLTNRLFVLRARNSRQFS